MKLCLATKNPGKLKELIKIAQEFGGDVSGLELVLAPAEFNPDETGETFLENAIIKAREAARLSGLTAVADDSGLCVDVLDGRPGIFSARYAEGDEAKGRAKLLSELRDVPSEKRTAAFVCAMALVEPKGNVIFQVQKSWKGSLAWSEKGMNGFGYDPIFIPDGLTNTSAEMPGQDKNRMSHRGQAWRAVLMHVEGNRWTDDPEFE